MKKRVLVIDDSIVILDLVQLMLQHEGYEVFTAQDGLVALEQLEMTTPDLILLDLIMPRMSGYDFIQEVQQHRKHFLSIPIILLTAVQQTQDQFEQLGAAGYLQKPFRRSELLSKLSDLLSNPHSP